MRRVAQRGGLRTASAPAWAAAAKCSAVPAPPEADLPAADLETPLNWGLHAEGEAKAEGEEKEGAKEKDGAKPEASGGAKGEEKAGPKGKGRE